MSGWSSQVVIADQIIIEGSNDYLLMYNGTPALGNLIASIAAMAGTDPYGNTFPAGITVGLKSNPQLQLTSNASFATLNFLSNDVNEGIPASINEEIINAGGVNEYLSQFFQGPALSTPGATGNLVMLLNSQAKDASRNAQWTVYDGVTLNTLLEVDIFQCQIGVPFVAVPTGSAPASARAYLVPGANNTGTGGASVPQLRIDAPPASGSDVDTFVSGSVIKEDRTNNNAPFTNQTPSLGAGWALGSAGGTRQSLQFRRDAFDNLVLAGVIHSTSATPASTIFTLPSVGGYRPTANQRMGVTANSGGTYSAHSLDILTTGVVSVDPAITAASVDLYIYGNPPLGHIP